MKLVVKNKEFILMPEYETHVFTGTVKPSRCYYISAQETGKDLRTWDNRRTFQLGNSTVKSKSIGTMMSPSATCY